MAVKLPIYMDNHATTPVDPRVIETMLPYFTEKFGNAASRNHSFGWAGEEAVENARAQVAALINATPKEIIFTSGATESDNLMIKGIAEMFREKGNHIITQAIEHKAVLDTCKNLEKHGFEVTYLPVQRDGRISLDDLKAAITPKTILITIMYANNEIGVINPIAEIGKIAKEHGIFFAVDGVQAVGKVPVDVQKDNIDLLAISGHKIYGPKGVGALYVRRRNPRVQLSAIIDGGGHERGMRSGTLNVPGIVGLGKACEVAQKEMPEEGARLRALRDRLKAGLEAIAQRTQPRTFLRHLFLCDFAGLAETNDTGHVQGAGTHAALVTTAINDGGKLHARIAAADVQSADPLGSINLVSTDGQQIDIVLLDVDRNLAHRLDAVHSKENAVFFGHLADFRDGIDHPDFVVGVHDGDQNRLRGNRRFQIVQADAAVAMHRH